MRIAVGCDHAGYEEEPYYMPTIIDCLKSLGHEVVDCGTSQPGAVDYPDYAQAVCEKIRQGGADLGLLMCGTGIGMGMAANRYASIRAAVCTSTDMARLSREHNNANVLCLGRRVLSLDECREILTAWLATDFSGADRHVRRVDKIEDAKEW